ncbi:MBOAT_2 domain-containing protein [Pseudozyma hubeiensis]|nr:MBOAT_2 domain-containing protein [Pseudozyma hubeiensis]
MSATPLLVSDWAGAGLAAWKWAVPDFHDKKPHSGSTALLAVAMMPLILVQIHLLIRYDPKTTWLLRASLIPFVTLLSLRSAYAYYHMVDGEGQLDGRSQATNSTIACGAIAAIIRSLEFGLAMQRPRLKTRRVELNGHGTGNSNGREKSNNTHVESPDPLPTFFPGTYCPLELDLLSNIRALGWEHGIKDDAPALPAPTYTSRQRWDWILKRAAAIPLYYLVYDVFVVLNQEPRFNPNADSRIGGSIWASTESSFGVAGPYLNCIAFGASFVCTQYMMHTMLASIFVGVFHDLPSRWDPPLVRYPWLSTSVADFWSRRWHQTLRVTFMTVGYWPVRAALIGVAGRRIAIMAAICGVFLVSGVFHDLATSATIPGFGITKITLFFAIQPIAMFGENMFEQWTGRKVQGFWGWLWAATWILGAAPILIEAFSMSGMLASMQPGGITRRPVRFLLDCWDRSFNGV